MRLGGLVSRVKDWVWHRVHCILAFQVLLAAACVLELFKVYSTYKHVRSLPHVPATGHRSMCTVPMPAHMPKRESIHMPTHLLMPARMHMSARMSACLCTCLCTCPHTCRCTSRCVTFRMWLPLAGPITTSHTRAQESSSRRSSAVSHNQYATSMPEIEKSSLWLYFSSINGPASDIIDRPDRCAAVRHAATCVQTSVLKCTQTCG